MAAGLAGGDATAALAQWTERHPVLDGFANPAAVVARCHSRDGRASELVAAVLTEAGGDPWAAALPQPQELPAHVGVGAHGGKAIRGRTTAGVVDEAVAGGRLTPAPHGRLPARGHARPHRGRV